MTTAERLALAVRAELAQRRADAAQRSVDAHDRIVGPYLKFEPTWSHLVNFTR